MAVNTLGWGQMADGIVPSNVDLNVLNASAQTRDGVGAGEVYAGLLLLADQLTREIGNPTTRINRLIGMTSYPTSDVSLSYHMGNFSLVEDVEHADPPKQHTVKDATMIAAKNLTQAFGWTWQRFRQLTIADVESTFERARKAVEEGIRKQWLTRIFSGQATAVPVGSGYSVGWVGANLQNYVPPDFEGASFGSDSHLSRVATNPAPVTIYNLLREHGLYSEPGSPIILLHGPASTATVKAFTKATNGDAYLPAAQAFTAYGASERAIVENYAHGVLTETNVLCVEVGGIPASYYGVIKSNGINSTSNPLARHIGVGIAQGKVLVRGLDTNPPTGASPLEEANLYFESGFGVAHPEAAAVQYIYASGSYIDPTIT